MPSKYVATVASSSGSSGGEISAHVSSGMAGKSPQSSSAIGASSMVSVYASAAA
jgi:hypothetical protein